ncbi:VOC family protein [Sphingomonas sp.]|jgi:predicted lactoylglutathione lyase|uniref:VOC family protein n=1 Tax=Sphingomonas sp. TaxID=28214 RepID=UPI0037514C2A
MADPQMIFVNLAVTDLAASRRFLEALGATNDPRFSDDTAAMMRFSDSVNFMLMTHAKFATFTDREIIDPRRQVQALLVLSRTDRAHVDESVEAAVAAGGTADPTPRTEYGETMYGRSVASPDGHMIKMMWMANIDIAALDAAAAPSTEVADA